MLTIERKMLNVKIKTYFFVREDCQPNDDNHLIGYSHSFVPKSTLNGFETLQIDLLKDEHTLLMEMHRTTRPQIRSALKRELTHIVIENPTDQELINFQIYYNQFAENKKTFACKAYHMQTMQLLREKNALLLTYMQDKEGGILCYRVYVTDGIVTMNLYSASHFRMVENPVSRRILSQANRLLIWQSMLWFKEKGNLIYDMGGLTDNENIRRFKSEFGGEIVPVYSGYEASSNIAKLILKLRTWKLVSAKAMGVQ